jgi:alpha-tubulin suppressor-like RCC1 family protein
VFASFTAVSAGQYDNTCATGPLGAFCWGYEGFAGNLGTGALIEVATTPVGVLGGERFVTISASDGFACGLTAEGALYCWGTAVAGRLGDGSVDSVRPRPVAVSGQMGFRSVATGRRHACGLDFSGVAWCWGGNSTGALGVPTSIGSTASPIPVATDVTFVAIGAGSMHSCGLTAEGVAYCWGRGYQLGDSVGASRSEPAPVHGTHRFRSLSVGWNHTCGVATDGRVYCWGASESGELGSAPSGVVTIPVAVADTSSFASVTAGYGASCGLLADGTAYCWGWNNAGQLGTGDTVGGPMPRRVVGGNRFSALSIGYVHTCGLGTDGVLYCWGAGAHGMLGDGSESGVRAAPVRVSGQRASPPRGTSSR